MVMSSGDRVVKVKDRIVYAGARRLFYLCKNVNADVL